ncbi:iron complex transport system substrate-binding protein [Treponema bryantii]|uniref:Iron complex transport system substrate-binding protein n=1 Tax=Treponema bryantii TaxID=163 RepID=A0A1H9GUF7_9SPIR|nr:helical backbone metal receptor [Treponema bryantii]SEQ53669.1 iron complex transport system substrate-binding protein [Treponema bryantii]
MNKKRIFTLFLFISLISALYARKPKTAESRYPKLIVALSPSAAEILFTIGAGDQVSAVSEFTDFPAEAKAKPVVGGFDGKTLSIETIMSFKPDLVYLTEGMHNFLISTLESNGIAYYVSKGESIASVEKEIIEVGKITGHEKEAAKVVDDMEKKLKKAAGAANKDGPIKVYWEVWNAPYMSAGSTSFINDVIKAAGGENIFADLSDAYPMVSEETIIAREPAVILIPASTGLESSAVGLRNGWADIPAVKGGRVFVVDDNVYTRPGPRVADVVLELSDLLK